MNILITGGAGYIGAPLAAELLSQGHRVRVLDNLASSDGTALLGSWSHPDFEFQAGDVRDRQTAARALDGVEAVVHLAAIVGDPACKRQPELARSVNLEASNALIAEAASVPGFRRFVFASTCSNYGKMPDPSVALSEDSELNPVSLYAETKVAVEKHLLELARRTGFPGVALRYATVYGVAPRMRFDLTVNQFAMEAEVKRKLVVFGQQFWRPYIHVRDVARAVRAVLEAPAATVCGDVFNVGDTRENYRKQDLIEIIRPVVGDPFEVELVAQADDPRDYRVSFQKIASKLDFQISRTVPDGILEVVRLVRSGVISDFGNPKYSN